MQRQVPEESTAPLAGQSATNLPVAAASRDAGAQWKYLGNNKRSILVVVSYAGSAYLPDEELNFLTKMLTACKLSLDDVAIVNSAHYPDRQAREYQQFFRSSIVFLFGPDPVSFGLPVSFPHYQVQAVAGTTYLFTPPLEERHRDDLLKSKLWVCLKRIFSL